MYPKSPQDSPQKKKGVSTKGSKAAWSLREI